MPPTGLPPFTSTSIVTGAPVVADVVADAVVVSGLELLPPQPASASTPAASRSGIVYRIGNLLGRVRAESAKRSAWRCSPESIEGERCGGERRVRGGRRGRDPAEGDDRLHAEGANRPVRHAHERLRRQEPGERDRGLGGESGENGRLENGVRRQAGDEPLDQLLREEGDRRDDRE